MKREHFVRVVEEALDSLPQEFRSRIRNVTVLVEDVPPNQPTPQAGQRRRLLLGLSHGVPTTKKSIFDLPTGPDHIVPYQKNIEEFELAGLELNTLGGRALRKQDLANALQRKLCAAGLAIGRLPVDAQSPRV